MASWADATDMVNRFSAATLGDLVTDSGTRVAEGSLAADTKMISALANATGRVKSEILQADRYDITAITDMRNAAHAEYDLEATEWLADVVCRVAFDILWDRKPWSDHYNQQRTAAKDEAKEVLEKIRQGVAILMITTAKDAGKPSAYGVNNNNRELLWSQVGRGRFYPVERT